MSLKQILTTFCLFLRKIWEFGSVKFVLISFLLVSSCLSMNYQLYYCRSAFTWIKWIYQPTSPFICYESILWFYTVLLKMFLLVNLKLLICCSALGFINNMNSSDMNPIWWIYAVHLKMFLLVDSKWRKLCFLMK